MTENEHMIVSRARPLVAQHEGFENRPYRDSVGVPTIGFGFALKDISPLRLERDFFNKNPHEADDKKVVSDPEEKAFWELCFKEGVPEIVSNDEYIWIARRLYCTRIVGDGLLLNKLIKFYLELTTKHPWVKNLDKARQVALLNMVYNLGLPRFNLFEKTIGFLKQGYYSLAAREMLDSKWARQVKSRAFDLAAIIRDGVFDTEYGTLDPAAAD